MRPPGRRLRCPSMLPIGDQGQGADDQRHGLAIATLTFFCLLLLAFAVQLLLVPGVFFIPPGLAFVPGALFGGAEVPAGVFALPPPATLVSYQLLHAGWLHLLGNLLFLWVFGPRVEGTLGPARLTVLLIVCGIAAALVQAWADSSSAVAMLGASGGISGVLGAYLYLHPHARIRVLVLQLPAYLVLVVWFAIQFFYANWTDVAGGGIEFRAHVGGFLAGVLLAPVLSYSILMSAEARTVARTLRSRDSRY